MIKYDPIGKYDYEDVRLDLISHFMDYSVNLGGWPIQTTMLGALVALNEFPNLEVYDNPNDGRIMIKKNSPFSKDQIIEYLKKDRDEYIELYYEITDELDKLREKY